MKLTLLGSGGWVPTPRRETCCALIREGDTAVLLDAGSGAGRLLADPGLVAGVQTLEIVLTHFHLDHVVGLSYLPAVEIEKRVWAPGKWLYGTRSEAILGRLVGAPLFAAEIGDVVSEINEIDAGGFELGSLRFAVRAQERHSHPTLALRVDDQVAYCTDTAYDEHNAGFAEGVGLLCHEAWHAAPATRDPTHTASGEAARVAAEASVGELVLIHVNPMLRSEDELLTDAVAGFPQTKVGKDLLEWPPQR